MKTAIVHDWLVTYAGSERAFAEIIALFPDADLYSLVDFLPAQERSFLQGRPVRTSFLQSLPFAKKKYRSYLPLMPLAVEQFDLSAYELVITSSHAVSKGVLTHSDQLHICYCYTPMRYAWDLYHDYLRESGLNRGLKGISARMVLHYLRVWDYAASARVDHFAAISRYIANRIKKNYHREATVIYPPVDVEAFSTGARKEDYYLTASRMVPYKKMDLIVEAFSGTSERKLVVIGDGPDFRKIRARAGRNVEFLGHQPDAVLKAHLQKARAFVFAADEDFGILPVEAQACGTPVIAFGKGGSLETVVPLRNSDASPTGVFYFEQTTEALTKAVHEFESNERMFDGEQIRKHALGFNRERFRREFHEFVHARISERIVADGKR